MARAAKHEKSSKAKKPALAVQRGSLVELKKSLDGGSGFAVVVSNDVQNELSGYVLVVPLERRVSRLKAPFSVDLGRSDGLRNLHTARCDWVTRIRASDIRSIERARLSEDALGQIERGLKVSLGLPELF